MYKTTFTDLPDDILTYLIPFLSSGSLYCFLGVSNHLRLIYYPKVISTPGLFESSKVSELSPYLCDILDDIFYVDSVPLFQYFEHILVVTSIRRKKILISRKSTKNGALNILKYLYMEDTPDYNDISPIASQYGQLEILQWLLKYKLDQDYSMEYCDAIYGGQLEIIKWLYENCQKFCPDPENYWKIFAGVTDKYKHSEVIKWLTDNEYM